MSATEVNKLKYKIQRLMNEKKKLESQISANGDILKQNSNVGLKEPLVDDEGYPRNDIDIVEVRRARQNIICFQNDYKSLMNEIENLMHQLHAKYKDANYTLTSDINSTEDTPTMNDDVNVYDIATPKPILKVSKVDRDSPAEEAGLQVDDEILELGTINFNNFNKNLETIGATIRHMQNQQVRLTVSRESKILNLILIPKVWSGSGLLGCKINIIN